VDWAIIHKRNEPNLARDRPREYKLFGIKIQRLLLTVFTSKYGDFSVLFSQNPFAQLATEPFFSSCHSARIPPKTKHCGQPCAKRR
jgi:hypothetical protein